MCVCHVETIKTYLLTYLPTYLLIAPIAYWLLEHGILRSAGPIA